MVSEINDEIRYIIKRYNVLEYKRKFFTNDDRLLLRSQKTNIKTHRKLPLKAGWKLQTRKLKNKKPTAYYTSYSEKKPFVSVNEYDGFLESEQSFYLPCFERSIIGFEGKDISVIARNNEFIIQLEKLKGDFDSRYRGALNVMLDLNKMGVVDYKGNAKTDRHKQESLRNVLNNWFKVSEYEYNYQFVGPVGLKIFNDLKTHKMCKQIVGNTTLYFQGYNKTSKTVKKIKMYNVTAKKEKRDYNNKSDTYKIEVTLCKEFFKKNNIDLKKLLTFDTIIKQKDIRDEVEKTFIKYYKYLTDDTKALVLRGFKMGERELFTEISNPDRTYHAVVREQSKMKMQIEGLIKQMNETSEMTRENRKMIERLIAN